MINGIPLVSTIGLEALVVAFLAPLARVKSLHLVMLSVIVNIMSQPLFTTWLKFVTYGQDYKWPYYFAGGEAAVIAIESILYFLSLRRFKVSLFLCALISTCANILSLTVGLFLPL